MELIPYDEFGKLRMQQLTPSREAYVHDGVEWMGGYWIEELFYGGTALYRHEATPDEAGGLTVDFRDLPTEGVLAIFNAIRLPLRPAMPMKEVRSVLGEAETPETFPNGNKSYDFTVGTRYPYCVAVAVDPDETLIYVAIIRKDVLSRCRY